MAQHGRFFEYADHWLSKRQGSENYYITFYEKKRRHIRRKTTHTDDLDQAKDILIAYVSEVSRTDRTAPDLVAIHEVVNAYLEGHLRDKPSYYQGMRAAELHLGFLEQQGVEWVAELKPYIVDRYIQHRRTSGISDDTIHRELSVLRASLNYARKQGLLDTVPYIRGLPRGRPRQRWLTPEEASSLIEACHLDHLRDYVIIALHTLARPRAIFDLTVDQVDLEGRTIDFLPEGHRQSSKRRPVVPISNTILPILERRTRSSESGHIIEYNGKPITTNLRKAFKQAARRAGLDKDVVPYTLRHTGATWLAKEGVNMRQIAGMLGHTVQSTTEIYAKHHPDFMREASSALDAVLPIKCDA